MLTGLAGVSFLAALAACGGGAGNAPAPVIARDSLRGVVRVTGSAPLTALLVVPAGADPVVPRGPDSTRLRNLTGLEVVLKGAYSEDCAADAGPRGARFFDVTRFIVRGLDGRPAVDGILAQVDGRWQVTDTEGTVHALAVLPPLLESMAGARVYLVGPLTNLPIAYGVIR
ncbi:MAG: hypothetical protein HY275_15865 [Gemmatimonadetes bacterium]|nr:hypothetical protein [Gemmatimonadota bacterium]